jgi:hypothetical protein
MWGKRIVCKEFFTGTMAIYLPIRSITAKH